MAVEKRSSNQPELFTASFLAICVIIFIGYCNITVFYNLYVYLAQIGIPENWRGFIIGCSSLSTILFFVAASPYLTPANAHRNIYLGVVLLIICGFSYLFCRDVLGLIIVRLLNGVGVFLITASALTLLVAQIPPSRSGQAFGLYSVASLLPYSTVPALFDWLSPMMASPAWAYALMSLALLPAGVMNFRLSKAKPAKPAVAMNKPASFTEMAGNCAKPQIAFLLLINAIYYLNFSGLFFLAKGLFLSRNMDNVGLFFSIQMVCMILVRVLANRIFDKVNKVRLVRFCYVLTIVGFAVVYFSYTPLPLYGASLILGLGMGLGAPSLNSLMYSLSRDRFKAINANLMMMSLHLGNFCGPMAGSAAVTWLGYGGFLLVGMAANFLGLGLTYVFSRQRQAQ